MDLDQFQREAQSTDQYPDKNNPESILIPMFGLIGEIGSLISTFKKHLRDKEAYTYFLPQLKEEIGDVLWYLANISYKYDLSLNEIANFTLDKAQSRWPPGGLNKTSYELYDDGYLGEQQIPREFILSYGDIPNDSSEKIETFINGNKVGDELTDNSYIDDGYRYHDIFHASYAAILGWSPVIRKLLKCKRKKDHKVDEVEDGARARILEEAISLYVYTYASRTNYLENISEIDEEILSTIRKLVSGLEVQNRTTYEWKQAIILGYEMFRKIRLNPKGKIKCNLINRELTFIE